MSHTCTSPKFRFFFFFNDPAPPEISPLPLPAAFPIFLSHGSGPCAALRLPAHVCIFCLFKTYQKDRRVIKRFFNRTRRKRHRHERRQKKRSEEHTSELQSQSNLVCRLLLEKKNK